MIDLSVRGTGLTLNDVRQVARRGQQVVLPEETRRVVARSARVVQSLVASGKRVYGVNTGFGALSKVTIPTADLEKLQLNLLRSHAAGTGPPLPEDAVRAMLLLRANTLANGHSGVRPQIVARLIEMLNRRVHPIVPCQGSVGASGDLAPLAHLALALIGEGRVLFGDAERPAAEALRKLGWRRLKLAPKEGLALINGTNASVAVGSLAVLDAEAALRQADLIGALSLEALRGRPSAFDERLHALRPIPGQLASAANLRRLLDGSRLVTRGKQALQDPYSLRCMPQVHGASRESVGLARRILDIEVNAVTDNPILFPDTAEVISGGNFHGEAVAQSLDAAAIGVASLTAIAERRLDLLVSGRGPGLPMFLTPEAGLRSGFMMVHVTCASLLNESKLLASPASVDNIPTSAGKEDHVSFSTFAARKLATIVRHAETVLGAELLAACQAIDMLGVDSASPAARRTHELVRAEVAVLDDDREIHIDLERARALVHSGALLEAAGPLD